MADPPVDPVAEADPVATQVAHDEAQETTEVLMALNERLEPVLAMVSGYRTRVVEAGFDEATADEMAAELHSWILAQMFS